MSILNPLSWFTTGVKAVDGVAKTFFGSQHDREQNAAMLDASVQQQYAAEFQYRDNRTGFDSLVDGMNRLVRPVLTAYICWLVFILPISNIDLFMQIITAYSAVPEPLWVLVGLIITFYFGGRMQFTKLQFKQQDIEKIKTVKKQIDEFKKAEQEEIEDAPIMDNPSIAAWRKTQSDSN